MAGHKTSIAVPPELLERIDRTAEQRGESRNRFIVTILEQAVRARRDAEITRRLDALFAERELSEEQARVAGELEDSAAAWGDEGW